ncbi:MAG: UbiD family decarboxylase, partial [Desulfovibrionales bacterium]|nr:UbiD family decarboxylase [Desulfovibrionales bacterium]
MRYRHTQQLVTDLEKHGKLIRVTEEVDPYLQVAEIQRRAFRANAPALLFTNVKGTKFPMVCNLFGTMERTRWIFRDT